MKRHTWAAWVALLVVCSTLAAQKPPQPLELKIDKQVYVLWENIKGTVGNLEPGENFKLELLDSFDRLIWYKDYKRTGTTPVAFDHQVRINPTVYYTVKVTTTKGRAASLSLSVVPTVSVWDDFPLILTGNTSGRTDAFFAAARLLGIDTGTVSGAQSAEGLLRRNFRYLVMQAAGADAVNVNPGNWDPAVSGYLETPDLERLQRNPSLSDPEALETWTTSLLNCVETHKDFRPVGYSLGEELSVTRQARAMDFSFDPKALDEFRAWLRGRYNTLALLNRAWDTDFRKWDDVMPLTTEQTIQAQFAPRRTTRPPYNFAPWCSHRAFMDLKFASVIRVMAEKARVADREWRSNPSLGIIGAGGPAAYGGYDWSQLVGVLDWVQITDQADSKRLVNSLNRALRQPTMTVTGVSNREAAGLGVWRLWNDMLRGDVAAMVMDDNGLVGPGDRLTEFAYGVGPTFRRVRAGVGRVMALPELEVGDDGVKLYYSPSSTRVQWMLDMKDRSKSDYVGQAIPVTELTMDGDRLGWATLLDDLNVGFGYVSSATVTTEPQTLSKFKALVLPKVISLSQAEADAIAGFVRGGGTVIADSQTGIFDEDGRELKEGRLDLLFGINRRNIDTADQAGSYRPFTQESVKLDTPQGTFRRSIDKMPVTGLYPVESGVEGRAAKQCLRAGRLEGLFVRRVDKGRVVYLNLSLLEYMEDRSVADGVTGLRGIVSEVLDLAGVKPAVVIEHVSGPPVQLRSYVRKMSRVHVVGLLREEPGRETVTPATPTAPTEPQPQPTPELEVPPAPVDQEAPTEPTPTETEPATPLEEGPAPEGEPLMPEQPVTTEPAPESIPPGPPTTEPVGPEPSAIEVSRVKVTLPEQCYAYEMTTGTFLGHLQQVELTVPATAPILLACLPYEVKEIRGQVVPEGGKLKYQLSVITTPTGLVGTHVFRMEFRDPKGDVSWKHSANITAPWGQAAGILEFVPGDAVGLWKMTITDVLSGKQAQMAVQVK